MKYIKKNLKPFTKSIASAINGKPIGGASAGKVKSVKHGIGRVDFTRIQQLKSENQMVKLWKKVLGCTEKMIG